MLEEGHSCAFDRCFGFHVLTLGLLVVRTLFAQNLKSLPPFPIYSCYVVNKPCTRLSAVACASFSITFGCEAVIIEDHHAVAVAEIVIELRLIVLLALGGKWFYARYDSRVHVLFVIGEIISLEYQKVGL